ncbi:hypothetical protein D3C87_1952180 [compost metagenome]
MRKKACLEEKPAFFRPPNTLQTQPPFVEVRQSATRLMKVPKLPPLDVSPFNATTSAIETTAMISAYSTT